MSCASNVKLQTNPANSVPPQEVAAAPGVNYSKE